MLVKYRDRNYIDKYKCIDSVKTFRALSSFDSGGLRYYKVDAFNYKVVEINMIIEEVK